MNSNLLSKFKGTFLRLCSANSKYAKLLLKQLGVNYFTDASK